jgi:hypothetical protein
MNVFDFIPPPNPLQRGTWLAYKSTAVAKHERMALLHDAAEGLKILQQRSTCTEQEIRQSRVGKRGGRPSNFAS